jgi:hypothetical protein
MPRRHDDSSVLERMILVGVPDQDQFPLPNGDRRRLVSET